MSQPDLTVYPLDDPAPGMAPVFHLRVDMDTSDPEAYRVSVDFAARLESEAICDALVQALDAASHDIGAYLGTRAAALATLADAAGQRN